MSDSVVFGKSLFGFSKKDVIEYIDSLGINNVNMKNEINDINDQLSAVKNENDKLRDDNEKLFDDNKKLLESIDGYKKEISDLQMKLNDIVEEAKVFDDIKDAEEKANKLMVDSLNYSEQCIKSAKEVSASITKNTQSRIDKAKKYIDGASEDFKTISGKIESSIDDVQKKLQALAVSLDEVNNNFNNSEDI